MAQWKEEDVSLLEQGIRHCERCPARANCQCPIPPEVSTPTDIMVIGEQPDQEDDLYNRPFYASGGRTLQRFLSQATIARQSVWMTNLTKCFKDGPHDPVDTQTCAGWLSLEFDIVQPKLVLLLGDVVTQFFYPTEKSNIDQSHGEFRLACTNSLFLPWQQTTFALLYNPYLLTDARKLNSFLTEDAQKLRQMCHQLNLLPSP